MAHEHSENCPECLAFRDKSEAPLQAEAKKAWQLAANLAKERTELRAKLAEQELTIQKWELIAGANAARAEAAEAEVAALREREKDGK